MAADYEQIRAENIARYGWDTAVLDLLGHLYSDRTHFIFELIQNAEDAGASELTFTLFADRLEVRHDGRPFTEADVRGVSGVAQSTKSGDLTRSAGSGSASSRSTPTPEPAHLQCCPRRRGRERFRIESYVRPFPSTRPPGRTTPGPGAAPGSCSRSTWHRARAGRGDRDRRRAERPRAGHAAVPAAPQPAAGRRNRRLRGAARRTVYPGLRVASGSVFRNPPLTNSDVAGLAARTRADGSPGHALDVEIAFTGGPDDAPPRVSPLDRSPLNVLLPDREGDVPRLPDPGAVPDDPGPRQRSGTRARQPGLRPPNGDPADRGRGWPADAGLLTVAALTALPLDPARFPPGSMFRPLFDTVRAALAPTP